jgi:hypothetical protein
MGGTGDLLSLSLNVPPWEDLHELSREELRLTNLITTNLFAQAGSVHAARLRAATDPALIDCRAAMVGREHTSHRETLSALHK